MSLFFQIQRYLAYRFSAVDAHSIHPPFAFNYYTQVIKNQSLSDWHADIIALRRQLSASKERVLVQDFGSGSKVAGTSDRQLSQIARNGVSEARFSNLLFRMAKGFKNPIIIELGTSIGLNSLYLASVPNSQVHTFEGCPQLSAKARQHFDQYEVENIQIHTGNIDQRLPEFLKGIHQLDMAFVDANHTYEATLRYFELLLTRSHEGSILVFDDIHWSEGMEKAWHQIQHDSRVGISIDLYKVGLVFLHPTLKKQHYTLRF